MDCCENRAEISGMYVKGFMDGKEEIESLQDRITGRFSCETIKNKEGEVLVKANHMITPKRAARIMKEGVDNITGGAVEQVKIRTILSCKCKVGVCAKCYGANMATGEPVQVGESIGIIAAQSIGEPGTQLTMRIMDGQVMEAGDELTEGSVNPHDILRIKGVRAVQDYMIREVQRVYRLQGVEINDKHIEVIVHQMLKKIRIEDNGDSEFLPGTLVDFLEYEEVNEKLEAEGLRPAIGKQGMLGITKASLATDSFLSAASFQETTKVLTEAAIKGKVDHLIGLKENVIIGKLIPAGTGMKCYSDVELDTGMPEEPEEIEFDEMDDEDQDVLDVAEDSEELETADEADLAVDEDEDTFEDEDSSEDSEE